MFWNLVFMLRVLVGRSFFAFACTVFGMFLTVYGPGGMTWLLDLPPLVYLIVIAQAMVIWYLLEVETGPLSRVLKQKHAPEPVVGRVPVR